MKINKDILKIIDEIPSHCKIVAATKYVDYLDMMNLLEYGINSFGENRVDAFLTKYEQLKDKDINWHFIGHLQRNKAKLVIDKIDYLHSLDSLELAKIIDKNRTTPLKCFIEVNINNEKSKSGIKEEELFSFMKEVLKLKNIFIVGLMTMSKVSFDSEEKYQQFLHLKNLLNKVNEEFKLNLNDLSMGMSDDYKEAIKASATFVRLGRILWM